jgi:LysM repeat protein
MHRVSSQRLAEVNQLRAGRLRGVTELLVPVTRKEPRSASSPRATQRDLEGSPANPTPGRGVQEVVVRRGDTLTAIAARHGTTPQALAQFNDRGLDDLLYPGDRLKVQPP